MAALRRQGRTLYGFAEQRRFTGLRARRAVPSKADSDIEWGEEVTRDPPLHALPRFSFPAASHAPPQPPWVGAPRAWTPTQADLARFAAIQQEATGLPDLMFPKADDLTAKDVRSMRPGQWLTDAPINLHARMINRASTGLRCEVVSTFFLTRLVPQTRTHAWLRPT